METHDRSEQRCVVLDTPEQINGFRLLTLLRGLRYEIHGFRLSRIAAFPIIKREFNLKGNKINVYNQFASLLGQPAYEPLANRHGERR